jgi:putrescine aminotransferase
VHGPGLMVAVELAGPAGGPATADTMNAVKQSCRDAGLLVSISNHMVLLTPPLVITAPEIELLVTRLERGVRAAFDAPSGSAGAHQPAQEELVAASESV